MRRTNIRKPRHKYIVYVGIFHDLGLAYVGLTRKGLETRTTQHKNNKGNRHVWRLIEKGHEIEWKEVDSNLSSLKAKLREAHFEKKFGKQYEMLNIAKTGGLGRPDDGQALTDEERKAKIKAYRVKNKKKIKAYYVKNREKIKAYRVKNKKKIKAQGKAYRLRNKKKMKANRDRNKKKIMAQKKAYRLKNRKKIMAYRLKNKKKVKAYRLKNRRMILAQVKAYYVKNRKTINARGKAYRIKNKKRIMARQKAYRIKNKKKD